MRKNELLLGAHVSIVGGFDHAIDRGEKIGANCIQIFTKSNRQWKAKKITENEAQAFQQRQKNSNIKIVVAHASYLINLGSTSQAIAEKSVHALIEELQRCDLLKIPFLVLHPGTMHTENEQESLIFIAEQINVVLQQAKPKYVTLLLETMAGQGSIIGHRFEQLSTILQNIKQKKHIGICVDTCHIFVAGYSFDTKESYKKIWASFDSLIGLDKIKVFHINDSKKEYGSKVDRHEHIGKGKISPQGFKLLLQDSKFSHIPKILETPKTEQFADDIKNIATLKKYAAQ